jgi:predicted HTH domain antitoxin
MTISIELPDEALRGLGGQPEDAAAELRLAAAMKLYELRRLSSGAAAELAGIPRVLFLEKLGEYGVSPFQYSADELAADVEGLRAASRQ